MQLRRDMEGPHGASAIFTFPLNQLQCLNSIFSFVWMIALAMVWSAMFAQSHLPGEFIVMFHDHQDAQKWGSSRSRACGVLVATGAHPLTAAVVVDASARLAGAQVIAKRREN